MVEAKEHHMGVEDSQEDEEEEQLEQLMRLVASSMEKMKEVAQKMKRALRDQQFCCCCWCQIQQFQGAELQGQMLEAANWEFAGQEWWEKRRLQGELVEGRLEKTYKVALQLLFLVQHLQPQQPAKIGPTDIRIGRKVKCRSRDGHLDVTSQ